VRVAPTWIRRPFTVGVVVGLSLLLSLAPLLLLVAAVLSPLLPGRWRPLPRHHPAGRLAADGPD